VKPLKIDFPTERSFHLQQVDYIWTIERDGYVWYEFDEKREALAMLAKLHNDSASTQFL